MKANLLIPAALYEHEPYETASTPWSTYPWQVGQDNEVTGFSGELDSAHMFKTIWRIDEDSLYFRVVKPRADVGNIEMFATLIVIDMWGNLGSDAGKNDPDPIPLDAIAPTLSGVSLLQVKSEAALILFNANEEKSATQGFVGLTDVTILTVNSYETLLIRNANEEKSATQGFVGLTDVTILTVNSTLI